LRKLHISDIDEVVNVHLEAFNGFFLSFLGRRFLKELYIAIKDDPTGIVFVFVENQKLLGFVAGTAQPAGFYRRLIDQRWFRFAMASISPVISNPRIIPRMLQAFNKPDEFVDLEQAGLLMSIAVNPSYQGKGIGQLLIGAFLQEAAKRNLHFVYLTTDKINNERANSFYQQLGFQFLREFKTPEERWMNEYVIDLNKHSVNTIHDVRIP
jgi:ribosomal protein S18 acetylase RimI-like enzyme